MANMLDNYKRDGVPHPTTTPNAPAGGPPTDFFASFLPQQKVQAQNKVRKVPLDLIDPWRDAEGNAQPFKPYSDAKLQELAENIKLNGLITPVRLRLSPFDTTRYQTLAGHNRIAAARLLGMTEIDAVVESLDDDTAKLIMLDSNLQQREKLLPSEKAFAYKIRLDALKRKAGRPTKENSRHVVGNFESADKVSSDESGRTVQRYISLTRLLPPLLDMVDADAIPFVAGVALSFLSSGAQEALLEVMRRESIVAINRSQAEALKEIRDDLEGSQADALILRIFGRGSAAKPPKRPSWKFETSYSARIVKKYQHDVELQRLIAETIRSYIDEREHG